MFLSEPQAATRGLPKQRIIMVMYCVFKTRRVLRYLVGLCHTMWLVRDFADKTARWDETRLVVYKKKFDGGG